MSSIQGLYDGPHVRVRVHSYTSFPQTRQAQSHGCTTKRPAAVVEPRASPRPVAHTRPEAHRQVVLRPEVVVREAAAVGASVGGIRIERAHAPRRARSAAAAGGAPPSAIGRARRVLLRPRGHKAPPIADQQRARSAVAAARKEGGRAEASEVHGGGALALRRPRVDEPAGEPSTRVAGHAVSARVCDGGWGDTQAADSRASLGSTERVQRGQRALRTL